MWSWVFIYLGSWGCVWWSIAQGNSRRARNHHPPLLPEILQMLTMMVPSWRPCISPLAGRLVEGRAGIARATCWGPSPCWAACSCAPWLGSSFTRRSAKKACATATAWSCGRGHGCDPCVSWEGGADRPRKHKDLTFWF